MGRLKNKVVLITGATSGIGEAAALRFINEGAKVFLTGRREGVLSSLTEKLGKESADFLAGDISKENVNRDVVQACLKKFGRLDVTLLNAGTEGAAAPIPDYPIEAFDELMAINVRGVFLGLKYSIPAMTQSGGSIVITSSIAGLKARGLGNSAYVASKHAEIGLMRTAAMENARNGIRVNCVLPGPTETRMMRAIESNRSPGAPEKAKEEVMAGLPIGRYGTVEEVTNLILFLASDESSVCTGGVYTADGGLSAY